MSERYLDLGAGRGLHLKDGVIAAVDVFVPGQGSKVEILDARGGALTAGRVCAHTHLYSGLAPFGLPAPEPKPESFVQILERLWWRLDRALDAPSLRASARYYGAMALLSGTTTLIDHHESPAFIEGSLDVLADASRELGFRLLTGYGATDRNGGPEEGARGLAECARFFRAVEGEDRLVGTVALHASFTCSDETVRAAGELCRELGAVMHVHLAEDGADVEDAKARGHAGVLQRLLALEALPPGSILAHGIHLSEEEVEQAAEAGCWFVQNPRSNEGNAVGYAASLIAAEKVALGTDGYPAVMGEEEEALLRLAAEQGEEEVGEAHLRLENGQWLASELFGGTFGDLAEGARADLVVWEDDPGGAVRHVLVAGEPVVLDGRLVGAKLEAIEEEARREAERLWARMRAL
ncbi:MAG: amidohydrolase family protein [Deltaproteobacteria bacterium]|nr:amidohydrolase family protein [Deltaproteobacteria bacterium]